MKRIFVVGGIDNIGSQMILKLRVAVCTVRVFDNLSRGHADAVGIKSITQSDWSWMDHNHP